MPNAIFIDTSNLNVLFKVGNRFSLGVNYASAPEKIAIDAQALGTAFDVYLSIWPRQRGECDDCVNALSVGGVPFIVIPEEVDAALKLVEKIPGVGTIYVCNALANFVKQARVANFQSVIPYGRRFALVTVKNSMLEDLRIYDTQDELYAEQGEGFTCYGDLDLIDIDGLKAQYDELTPFDKKQLVPITHLVTSYRSPYNTEDDIVRQELYIGEYADQRYLKEPPPPPPEPEPPKPKRQPMKPRVPTNDFDDEIVYKKPSVSIFNVLLIFIILAGCAICGLGYSFDKASTEAAQISSALAPMQAQITHYGNLTPVYSSQNNVASFAANLLRYAKTNSSGFTVAGMEIGTSSITLQCNCMDADGITAFQQYLEQQYVVGEVNSLDTTQGANATIIYNYNVIIVVQ